MRKQKQENSAGSKKPRASVKIQIQDAGGRFIWESTRKVANRIRRGEDIKTTKRTAEALESLKSRVQSNIIHAKPLTYEDKALKELRGEIMNKKGQFLTRAKYDEINEELSRARNEDDKTEILIKLQKDNPNINLISESENKIFHFQGADSLARMTDGEADGARVVVKDFEGNEFTFTGEKGRAEAVKMIAEMNATINAAIKDAQGDGKGATKKKHIYINLKEKTRANSKGKVIELSYDFFDLQIQGIKAGEFYGHLDNNKD